MFLLRTQASFLKKRLVTWRGPVFYGSFSNNIKKDTVSISTNSSGRWRHNYEMEGAEGALEKKYRFFGRRRSDHAFSWI